MTAFAQLGHFEDGFGADDWQDCDVLLDIWSSGGGSSPVQGNSARYGRFIHLPHLVLYQFQYGVGSTFVKPTAADVIILSLPVPARRQIGDHPLAVDKVMGFATITFGAISTKNTPITPILSDYPGKTYGPGAGSSAGVYGGTCWAQFLIPEEQDEGVGTIAAGTSTVHVPFTRTLQGAPLASDLTITWTALSGGAGVWKGHAVTNVTATGFDVTVNANTSTDMTFGWKLSASRNANALTGSYPIIPGTLLEGFLFYEPEIG